MYGIPSYEEKVSVPTLNGIISSLTELGMMGINVDVQAVCGDALISRARNSLFALGVTKEYDDLVFIDDDVGFESGAMPRLLSHKVDLVAGLYPVRHDGGGWMLRWDQSDPSRKEARLDPRNGLLEVDSVPTGFFRMTNHLMRSMAQHYDERWYHDHCSPVPKCWAVFDVEMRDHSYWGEDFLFCQRWRALEGQVWIDPWLSFSHTGRKTWSGCFGTYKQAEVNQILEQRSAAALEEAIYGKNPPEEGEARPPVEISTENIQDAISDLRKTEERAEFHLSGPLGRRVRKPVGPPDGDPAALPPGLQGYLKIQGKELVLP